MKQEETNAVREIVLSILTVEKCASQDVVDEALKSVERVFHLALLQVCCILLGERGVTCEMGIDGARNLLKVGNRGLSKWAKVL